MHVFLSLAQGAQNVYYDSLIIDRVILCNLSTGAFLYKDEIFILIIPHRGKDRIPPFVKLFAQDMNW